MSLNLNLETRFSYNYKKSTFTKTDGRMGPLQFRFI